MFWWRSWDVTERPRAATLLNGPCEGNVWMIDCMKNTFKATCALLCALTARSWKSRDVPQILSTVGVLYWCDAFKYVWHYFMWNLSINNMFCCCLTVREVAVSSIHRNVTSVDIVTYCSEAGKLFLSVADFYHNCMYCDVWATAWPFCSILPGPVTTSGDLNK